MQKERTNLRVFNGQILKKFCFRFCTLVEEMTGEKLHGVWTLCWFIISPAILVALIVLGLYDMTDPDRYLYSAWSSSTVRMKEILMPLK